MRYLLAGILLAIGLMAGPVSAFSIETLDISVDGNGNANVTAGYSLSWIEQVVVFMKIAHPELELEHAISLHTGMPVQVVAVGPRMAELRITGFASVKESPGTVVFTTAPLDFSGTEAAVKRAWFARFVTVDASPERAVIRFPDGYEAAFADTYTIPATQHEIAG